MTDKNDRTVSWLGQSLTQKEFDDYTSQPLPLQIKSKLEASQSLFEFDAYAYDIRNAISGLNDEKLKKTCHAMIDAQRAKMQLKWQKERDSIELQRRKEVKKNTNSEPPLYKSGFNDDKVKKFIELYYSKSFRSMVLGLDILLNEKQAFEQPEKPYPFLAYFSTLLTGYAKKFNRPYQDLSAMPGKRELLKLRK